MPCAISNEVRFFEPLKTICSIKWEIPLLLSFSSLEPEATQTPTVAERSSPLFSRKRVRPFSRVISFMCCSPVFETQTVSAFEL